MAGAWASLGDVPPRGLAPARLQVHHAAQWLTRAARANLAPAPDDSHSNLGWDGGLAGFVSHDLPGAAGPVRVNLTPGDLVLAIDARGARIAERHVAGEPAGQTGIWLDGELVRLGLEPATPVVVPYDMPAETGDGADPAGRTALAAWFDCAAGVLDGTVLNLADISPGPTPVRCWPHHFDIATLVRLEQGGAEDARSIGIGLSPGDESYDQPYFYVTPWPYPDAPTLPALRAGHWRGEGFTAAILTGEEIVAAGDPGAATSAFIATAVAAWRTALGV